MSTQDTACNLDFITIVAQVQYKARGGLLRRKMAGVAVMDHRGRCSHGGGKKAYRRSWLQQMVIDRTGIKIG